MLWLYSCFRAAVVHASLCCRQWQTSQLRCLYSVHTLCLPFLQLLCVAKTQLPSIFVPVLQARYDLVAARYGID